MVVMLVSVLVLVMVLIIRGRFLPRWQDLCVLARGEQGQWIKRTSVSATLGLELVEQVTSLWPTSSSSSCVAGSRWWRQTALD